MTSTPSHHLPPEALRDWLAAAAEQLDLDPDRVPIGLLLDVARDVAHGVARPAAPLTTFLMGLALAREPEREDVEALAARVTALALEWPEPESAG